MVTNADRLAELSMVPDLAKEVVTQIGVGGTPATTTTFGTVKKAATVANVTPATDGTAVGTAFNTLLTNLRAAGIIV